MPKTSVLFESIRKLNQGPDPDHPGFGELLDLTEDQEKRVKLRLKEECEAWISDSADQHEKLRHWHDLAEGIIEESDYPYEGAFETHIDMIGIFLKVYHSIERRSILGSDNIWYAEADPGYENIQDQLPEIENVMNYKARAEWNIEIKLSAAFACANRDGLAGLYIPYAIETEQVEDKILVSNAQEFLEEFGNPEEAGISRFDWAQLLALVMQEASDETPIEIPISYERVTYEGPKAYLVERADLVIFPATAQSMDREYCRGYGYRSTIRREEVRRRMISKEWHEDACREFLKKTKKGKGAEVSDYRKNKESIVGLGRSKSGDDYEFFELVYRMRLDNKGSEKKYHFIYSKEHDLLMLSKVYVYRVDIMALFWIDARANQMDGKSVTGQLEFLNEAVDLMYNQRFQSREITNVPSFKAKKDLKAGQDAFDAGAEENQWRPGVIFWLKEPDAFEQFKVQPVDLGESLQEEQNLFRIASMIMGVDISLFSGRTPVEDPQAPGNKTALLVDMGNLRMEDPLAELRYGVEQVGMICLSHLYQFGPAIIEYKTQEKGRAQPAFLKKRILRTGIKIKMQGITVAMNSDSEFRKWIERYMVLAREPVIARNDVYRTESLRRALRGGRIPGADKILPPMEEIKAQMVETTKQALMQILAEQQAQQVAQQVAQQEEQVKAEQQKRSAIIKMIGEKIKSRELTEKLAEQQILAGGGNGR